MTDEEKQAIEYIEESFKTTITHKEKLEIIKNLIEKLQTENKNLKERDKEHQELNGRLRTYIKELEEKVEKYRSDWE